MEFKQGDRQMQRKIEKYIDRCKDRKIGWLIDVRIER